MKNRREQNVLKKITEMKENNVFLFLEKSIVERGGEKQHVTITGITRRCSTIDQDSLDQSRSAPSSPAQSRQTKRRSSNARVPLSPIESVSSTDDRQKASPSFFCCLLTSVHQQMFNSNGNTTFCFSGFQIDVK